MYCPVHCPVKLAPLQGAPLSSIPKPQIETGVKAKVPATVCTCQSPDKQDFGAPIQFSERGSHSGGSRPAGRASARVPGLGHGKVKLDLSLLPLLCVQGAASAEHWQP